MHKYFWRILILKRPSLFLEDEMLRFSLLLSIFEIPENLGLYNDDEDDWCWFTPLTVYLTVIFNWVILFWPAVATNISVSIGGEFWKVSRNVGETKNSIHIGIIDIIIYYNTRYQV